VLLPNSARAVLMPAPVALKPVEEFGVDSVESPNFAGIL